VFIPLPPRRGPCRLHYTTFEDLLAAYLRAAGVTRRIRFHGLRHTAGTTLSDRGVPLQDIQDLLRHKSPKTTRRYARVAKERLAEVLDHELRFPE
jgi:integrase